MMQVLPRQTDLLAALDIAVLEIESDGLLFLASQDAGWFEQICPSANGLAEYCPFAANFLIECEESWPAARERLHSGSWVQRDLAGNECTLEAWAVRRGGRKYLLVRQLGEEAEDYRRAFQAARDRSLANEKLGIRNLEVERINSLKTEFLASMSHELRTPLNAIIGFSSLLADEAAGPVNPEQHKFLGHVTTASRHLLSLINDILDLSKIEAGRLELDLTPFAFAEALREVLTTLQPLAVAKNIELVTLGDSGNEIYGDRIRVKQILYNLLSNAIKFTPRQGRVTLRSWVTGSALSVSIADTGIGIPAEEQQAIFEKFHQVPQDRLGMHEGTGLGLAISKRLVEQHGGRISVRSEPGRGAEFVFSIPLSERPAAPEEVPPLAPVAAPCPGMRIAVIDGNAGSRALLEAMLRPFYGVTAFADGMEAIESFAGEAPDVIIADGPGILHSIRAVGGLRNVPVIAASAHAMTGDREKFLAEGFDAYIAKPIESRELFDALRRVVRVRVA